MTPRFFLSIAACLAMAVGSNAQTPAKGADTTKKTGPAKLTDKIKTSRKIEGLLTLYQDTSSGSVQLYVRKDQLGKEFIYQSFAMGGPADLFLNQSMPRVTWIFKMRKSFDKLEFSQVNTNFYYDSSNLSNWCGRSFPERQTGPYQACGAADCTAFSSLQPGNIKRRQIQI